MTIAMPAEDVAKVRRRRAGERRRMVHAEYAIRVASGAEPLFSLKRLERLKLLAPDHREILTIIRQHNALLFDFVLKRSLGSNGRVFSVNVFETRHFFERLA